MRRCFLLLLVGCVESRVPTEVVERELVVARDCFQLASDALGVGADVTVDGDLVRVTATYSGGCEEHAFQGCWDGGIVDGASPYARIRLVHDARNDRCEGTIAQRILIDVGAVPPSYRVAAVIGPDTIALEP